MHSGKRPSLYIISPLSGYYGGLGMCPFGITLYYIIIILHFLTAEFFVTYVQCNELNKKMYLLLMG